MAGVAVFACVRTVAEGAAQCVVSARLTTAWQDDPVKSRAMRIRLMNDGVLSDRRSPALCSRLNRERGSSLGSAMYRSCLMISFCILLASSDSSLDEGVRDDP